MLELCFIFIISKLSVVSQLDLCFSLLLQACILNSSLVVSHNMNKFQFSLFIFMIDSLHEDIKFSDRSVEPFTTFEELTMFVVSM